VYLLVFIRILLIHLAEKILLLQPTKFGGDYPHRPIPCRTSVHRYAECLALCHNPRIDLIAPASQPVGSDVDPLVVEKHHPSRHRKPHTQSPSGVASQVRRRSAR